MRIACLLPVVVVVACGGTPSTPTPTSAPTPPPADPGGPDGNARLDHAVVPTAYDLDLTVDPAKDAFAGVVRIAVRLAAPTTTIRLHAQDLVLSAAGADVGGEQRAAQVTLGTHGGILLSFDAPLPAGDAILTFQYTGPLDEVPQGLYRVEDGGKWYAFTQFEALDAREAFPCFDQPEFKTPYRVTIRAPKGQLAVSNYPETARADEGEQTVFTFAETRPLPSYLVAFAVGPLEIAEGAADAIPDTPLRLLATAGKGKLAAYALARTPLIHAALSAYFDTPHPFAKLDLLAVPNFAAGAMENVGLVTFRETLLLLDGATAPAERKMWSQVVIAHELAHMWFGDMVTMTWWNDLWLNEAFATWMAGQIVAGVDPTLEMDLEMVGGAQYTMATDSQRDTRAIRQPIRDGGDVSNAFDGITYGKGAAVLRMLESWVGPETFRDGVRAYIKAHAYGSATTEDLMAALDAASGKPVGAVAKNFLDQPGVPLVTMSVACGDKKAAATLTMKQQRYLPTGSDAPQGLPWQVPVCVHYGVGGATHRQCALLEGPERTVTLEQAGCPDWLQGNADQQGYYQWVLPADAMRGLASARYDDLSPPERVALPGVLSALVAADALPMPAWLDGITALSKRSHRLVIEGVIASLAQLDALAVDDALRPAFAAWARALLGPHATALGGTPREGETTADTLLRPQVLNALAHLGQDQTVRAQARTTVEAFLDTPGSVPPEVLTQALPVATWSGDAVLWQRLRQTLDTKPDPVTQVAIIGALGSFEDPALLARSFDLVLDGALRAQDFRTMARGIREPARAGAWAWLDHSYDRLVARVGTEASARLPWMGAGFCTLAERATVEAFFTDPKHAPEGTARNLGLVLEGIDRCVRRRAALRGPLEAWLQANGYAQR